MRVTALGVPYFQHDGVAVGAGWTAFDYDKAEGKARKAFCAYVGTFIRIHPEDVAELERHGLALEGGRIVEPKARAKGK